MGWQEDGTRIPSSRSSARLVPDPDRLLEGRVRLHEPNGVFGSVHGIATCVNPRAGKYVLRDSLQQPAQSKDLGEMPRSRRDEMLDLAFVGAFDVDSLVGVSCDVQVP